VDDATWTQGSSWASTTALNACTSYAAVNPGSLRRPSGRITEALIG
jgi:hypothetical protein